MMLSTSSCYLPTLPGASSICPCYPPSPRLPVLTWGVTNGCLLPRHPISWGKNMSLPSLNSPHLEQYLESWRMKETTHEQTNFDIQNQYRQRIAKAKPTPGRGWEPSLITPRLCKQLLLSAEKHFVLLSRLNMPLHKRVNTLPLLRKSSLHEQFKDKLYPQVGLS